MDWGMEVGEEGGRLNTYRCKPAHSHSYVAQARIVLGNSGIREATPNSSVRLALLCLSPFTRPAPRYSRPVD